METTVEWDLPEGYKASDLEWATPKKIPYGDLTNYGYEDSVTLLQDLTVPANAPSEPLTINGKVNVLVCHDICIPETHDVSLTLNSAESFNADEIKMAQANLPKALEAQASHYQENSNLVLEIQNTDITFSNDIYLAPEQWGIVNNNADASIKQTDTNIKITQQRGDRDLAEVSDLAVVIVDKQNGQSHRIVAIPDTQKSAAITPNLDTALDTTKGNLAEKKSELTFATAFMFALLGGLILNLMPCVFPVLSMKALSLVQLSGKEESKAKQYGLSYTAGILISFGLIAGILIALKSAGAQIGWGFQLQNPVVISLLIYMIFLIGLNLSGFFELTGRFTNMGQNLASQSGNKGAFFTGVLATLVATPCTAPFMGAAMGYALTQGALSSMIVFLALGFGLALPYLALCYIPALRTKLPKPGAWMETFRQFLAFPMFLTAAFLVWVLVQQAGSNAVLVILCAMVALTFAIWLWRVVANKTVKFVSVVALILFAMAAPFTLTSQTQTATTSASSNVQVFSQAKLDELLKGDAPIFTNMTAAWCITCQVNERVAISRPSVQEIFANKKIEYLKGDWTNKDDEITQYLNGFNRQGVPLYVYYGPRDPQTGNRPEPVLLPQILTTGIMKETLK